MRSLSLLLLAAATLAAAIPAAAQTAPRRPPADTVRFGATRPSAGDSIRMADYDAEDEDAPSAGAARGDDDSRASAAEDTVPPKPRDGPYARARGTGPFTVQASGETAARPPRGEVVWLEGRAAARRDTASARRDTAAAGTGQRVASGQTARRDTASASRPARRDTATATTRPATRRDTASTGGRPAARDTGGARRNGQSASTSSSTSGRNGSASASSTGANGGRTGSTSTSSSTGGRAGSTSSPSTSANGGRTGSGSTPSTSSGARARTHTVASGETFYAIARRYGVTAAQLRALNPDVQQDDLEVGDVLRLPASARDSRASGSSSSSSSSSGSGAGSQGRTGSQTRQGAQGQRRSHTVAAGETLFGIARRYGVTVDAIREANDMEGDQVRTGQRLVIPPAR